MTATTTGYSRVWGLLENGALQTTINTQNHPRISFAFNQPFQGHREDKRKLRMCILRILYIHILAFNYYFISDCYYYLYSYREIDEQGLAVVMLPEQPLVIAWLSACLHFEDEPLILPHFFLNTTSAPLLGLLFSRWRTALQLNKCHQLREASSSHTAYQEQISSHCFCDELANLLCSSAVTTA